MEKFLEVKNLRVSYHSYAGEVQSVRGVSFSIDAGQSVAIVGESGCGKSVTAKTIMGLIQTPPGEIKEGSQILFEGRDILSQTAEQWQEYRGKDCAIIFQDALAALNPTMTIGNQVAEKLLIHTSMSRAEAWEEAGRLLKLVGIPNPEKRMKQYPHEFSGGQRQRIMIAIALACQPRLLIADEPTTALDVTIQADIIDLLKDIQKEFGMAVIMITHDLGIVANIAKKIIVMYAGKVVETGSSQDIFYRPRHPYTKALLRAVPRLDTEEEQSLESIEGTPPNMIDPPAGCAFSTRCFQCMRICQKSEPPMFEFEDGHTAQCWLYHPMAAQGNEE